ncbi:uncharacterized protein sb:cb1058 [Takifugu flavidus]|uniref:Uncharacterized protein n=1 Tax=Takifugu flavidus TaxID=433684 RepID=A0A5C6N884_9TELE|nr:uncharacterized protein sb:cb1058 [Takifugu flavidus]TWW63363.1 hypothetical protein D4764_03G0003710 [Takifugu flavidus]
MTIGRNSRNGSARSSIRAPKFLDKSGGFYCRLDEPVAVGDGDGEGGQREKADDFSEGVMEDDGETLLQRKASRRSSRWRRSSRRKQRETEGDPAGMEEPAEGQAEAPGSQEVVLQESAGGPGEPTLGHFTNREEADDRVLIRDAERGHGGEGEEERRAAREQKEGMKMVKRMTAKNYRKALDQALRRGWEAFITNLYSITLTPVTSPSPPLKKKQDHGATFAEIQVTARPL